MCLWDYFVICHLFRNLYVSITFTFMSRQARQRSDTDIYHVILRGIDRMPIFRRDDDRQMFLNFLRLQISAHFKVYGYCLMDNHIHILVKSDNLSVQMHHLASLYAMRFNHKYNRCGYLFQNRFKSEAVESEGYFLRCLRYILRNPVKAGICRNPSAYRWSSYHAYFTDTRTYVNTKFLAVFFQSKQDFEEYMAVDNTDRCIDTDQLERLTDEEVKHILNQKLSGKKFEELPKSEKYGLLRELKSKTNVSLRQLARITHISYNIIRRL